MKETDNVEIYFICDRKEEMDLVESHYDEESNTHHWYFNAYLAYTEWKNDFKGIVPERGNYINKFPYFVRVGGNVQQYWHYKKRGVITTGKY